MLLLKPIDLGRNRRCARFDAPVIGLDDGRCPGGLADWIVKKQGNILLQRALMALQSQRIVTILIVAVPATTFFRDAGRGD